MSNKNIKDFSRIGIEGKKLVSLHRRGLFWKYQKGTVTETLKFLSENGVTIPFQTGQKYLAAGLDDELALYMEIYSDELFLQDNERSILTKAPKLETVEDLNRFWSNIAFDPRSSSQDKLAASRLIAQSKGLLIDNMKVSVTHDIAERIITMRAQRLKDSRPIEAELVENTEDQDE